MGQIRRFQQLNVWQEAHELVLMVYEVTKQFPRHEQYGLISQMCRAAISIPANIAEGFKRHGTRDKIRFYNISEGSLEELKYFFILYKDLDYVDSADHLIEQSETVGRLLNGLIKSTKRRLPNP